MFDSATSWTIARQAPKYMGFSREEYWSGMPTKGIIFGLPQTVTVHLSSESLPSEFFVHTIHISVFYIHYHRLNGHGFGWTPGVGDGQGGLVCCGSWGCKESDTTERLN